MASETSPLEADREGDLAHPRTVYDLFGHDGAERAAASAFERGRLHHAWMITGPKGVGKASFAYRLARRALGAQTPAGSLQADPADPVCRLLEAQAHPDFLLLRRAFDDKRGKLRGEITVEDARRAPEFFSKRASGPGWRVALVDAADELNVNAANALLKTLEEPPQKGLLILVVHAPGRLPVTIRSRCRRLILRPPTLEACARWLQARGSMSESEAERAAALAGGAPGRALALAESGAVELHQSLEAALAALPQLDRAAAAQLADAASAKGGEGRLAIMMAFLRAFAHAQALRQAHAEALQPAEGWARAGEAVERLAREAQTLYLDPRQVVRESLAILRRAAAQAQGR